MASYAEHPPLNEAALRELVEGGSAPFKPTPRSYILWCPQPDCRRQKLYVERRTGMSKCFRCGFRGWANWVLAKVYDRSPEELGELLYGIVSVGTIIKDSDRIRPDFWGEEEPESAILQVEPKYPPPIAPDPMWTNLVDPLAVSAVAYLEKRGVPLSVAQEYGIGFHPGSQRVLIPVIVEGKLRGWQGRYIHATTQVGDGRIINIPKVVTTGKLGKECFMFQDRLQGSRHAILTEGPFDALKCHPVGGNVASMGKDVSTRQLDIIVRSGVKRLYVGLDRDAFKEVAHIVKVLYGTLELYRLLPPAWRDDLGECTMEEATTMFEAAEPMGPMDLHQTYRPSPKLWT